MKWKLLSGRAVLASPALRGAAVALAVSAATFGSLARGGNAAEPEGPPAPAPAGYVGSDACKACHADVVRQWDSTAHGKRLADPALPEADRGCEACHGPGSAHVGSMGRSEIGVSFAGADPAQVEESCGRCHLSGHSSTPAAPSQPFDQKRWRRTLHARQQVSCLSCHKVHGGADRSLQQPASELCLSCHQSVVNKAGGYTHQPVASGQCLLCHDPHGSAAKHNLVDNVPQACLSCHQAETPAFTAAHKGYSVETSDCLSCHNPHSFDHEKALLAENQHAPFASGQCQVCHDAPSPGLKPTLTKPVKEQCLGCHPASKIMPATNAQGKKLTVHPPVEQGLCTQCHNPHATDQPMQMKDRTAPVCFSCHAGIEEAASSEHRHGPVETGNCTLCHRGHVSPEPGLLNTESIALCESCHVTQGSFTHPVGVVKGKPVRDPNTKQLVTCARCHAVHGSNIDNLLPQDMDDLCRGCHKK